VSAPPKFQSVQVVTHGRSASTLLMGLLNSIEGYLIPGGTIRPSTSSACSGARSSAPQENQKSDPTRPWYNEIDGEAALARMRELYRELLTRGHEARVFGFKEIR
jgi:hypothetical protein